MSEREPGAGRQDGEAVAHSVGLEPVPANDEYSPAVQFARLIPRPDQCLSFPAALDEAMRDHDAVFAALAK